MWIPENLIRHRILGKYRMEPCKCGHYHVSRVYILPKLTINSICELAIAVCDERDNESTG
jgi:hypothetical protein